MKSRLALVAMLVMAAAPLAAQGGGGAPGGGRGMGGGRGGMNIEALTTLYTLTPEQVTKADALIKAVQVQMMPLQQYQMAQRQAQAEVNSDSTKKLTELRTKFNADFKALLTADQAKKFDSVQTAQAARMGGGRGPGGL